MSSTRQTPEEFLSAHCVCADCLLKRAASELAVALECAPDPGAPGFDDDYREWFYGQRTAARAKAYGNREDW
jgi:hypothetical protein